MNDNELHLEGTRWVATMTLILHQMRVWLSFLSLSKYKKDACGAYFDQLSQLTAG